MGKFLMVAGGVAVALIAVLATLFYFSPLSVTVESPQHNQRITRESIAVSGRYSGLIAPEVEVDSVVAAIVDGRFEVKGVAVDRKRSITATATWSLLGIQLKTMSHPVEILPTPEAVLIDDLREGTAVAPETASASISGTYRGPSGARITVNDTPATVSGHRFRADGVPLSLGNNALVARASIDERAVTDSRNILRQIDCRLEIDPPPGGWTTEADHLAVRGRLIGAGNTVTVEAGGRHWPTAGREFTIELALPTRINRFIVSANSPYCLQRVSHPLMIARSEPRRLRVVIDDPPRPDRGEYQTASDRITVTGTVTATGNVDLDKLDIVVSNPVAEKNTRVAIQRRTGAKGVSRFRAVDVLLQEGENRVRADARLGDLSGSDKRLIVRRVVPNLRFEAAPQTGRTPLSVTFAVTGTEELKIQSAVVRFGDGAVRTLDLAQLSKFPHIYTSGGTYRVELIIADQSRGEIPLNETVIAYADEERPPEVIALGESILKSMLRYLAQGMIDEALAQISGGAYEKYKRVFLALQEGGELSQVVDRIGEIHDGRWLGDVQEILVSREASGTPRVFGIYLLKSEDGRWRIEGM